MNKIEILGATI